MGGAQHPLPKTKGGAGVKVIPEESKGVMHMLVRAHVCVCAHVCGDADEGMEGCGRFKRGVGGGCCAHTYRAAEAAGPAALC